MDTVDEDDTPIEEREVADDAADRGRDEVNPELAWLAVDVVAVAATGVSFGSWKRLATGGTLFGGTVAAFGGGGE